MKFLTLSLCALFVVTACSQHADVESALTDSVAKTSNGKAYDYMIMSKFNENMARFVGLVPGDSMAQAESKINAVFKAYDGHAEPLHIGMDKSVVEADWKQVLVTQNGLMDGTVTGQQLLAIFNAEDELVTYGMRIKCFNDGAESDWQNSVC